MIPVVKFGSYVLMCENVYLNKRTWHFRRRVPEDVRHLHRKIGRKKPPEYLDFSLKTQNKEEAARKAHEETLRLDRLWAQARSDDTYIPKVELALQTIANAGLQPGVGAVYPDLDPLDTFVGDYLGYQEDARGRPTGELRRPNPQQKLTLDILYGAPVPKRLSEARDKHWALGIKPKNKVAQGQFDRAWEVLMQVTGDCYLTDLKREHANIFVEKLIAQGLGKETIRKYLSQIRPFIMTGIREFEIKMTNPFEEVIVPKHVEEADNKRLPFSRLEIERIQTRCVEVDDPYRWLIALLSDTGMRLAEGMGLEVNRAGFAGGSNS